MILAELDQAARNFFETIWFDLDEGGLNSLISIASRHEHRRHVRALVLQRRRGLRDFGGFETWESSVIYEQEYSEIEADENDDATTLAKARRILCQGKNGSPYRWTSDAGSTGKDEEIEALQLSLALRALDLANHFSWSLHSMELYVGGTAFWGAASLGRLWDPDQTVRLRSQWQLHLRSFEAQAEEGLTDWMFSTVATGGNLC
ncbi:hypothetical protein B0A49_10727 [Cryomyces minteri]|uniref:Uncharacterized protein n=1 Tax=Cryomyces minteri TaxID=331657 RepID=A0A4U0W7L4_9PEZI|nr:hypothetical protein B0A49_10727 [Cryomyces minteri]